MPSKDVGVVSGQLRASTRGFSKDNCFPSAQDYEFKNKSQWPSCLKNHLGKNVVESNNNFPNLGEPEGGEKRYVLTIPLKESDWTK